MADEISLTIPREPDFHRVAHLVLGGLAVRLDLTIEHLEDLQLALDSLLDATDPGFEQDVTVRMRPRGGSLVTVVGPLSQRVLEEVDGGGDGLSLRRVLDSTVDAVEVDGDHVLLTKQVARG
ncbi:MAG TPA: hypothetical protein VFA05_11140 [Gaiellaceae bacterium]|nr:hypothetical protein [Gaiellaceae bacterium]